MNGSATQRTKSVTNKEATARIKINKLLEAAGWRFFAEGAAPANIRLEPSVTLKSSDLDALGENFEKTGKGFIDFLLLDAKGFPLIVLEAKSEDKNPLVGKEQARKYAKSQNCRFVILSNGNLHYFWDLERGNPYLITSFPTPDSVTGYQQVTPNPQRLIEEVVNDDYIALTLRPHYQSDAAWRNEAERPGYIQANKLRFLRPYQLKAVHVLQQAVQEGKDRFLFEMATGTGKTLTAAAVIKLFLRSGNARRVLFLVDRLELEDQAKKAFAALLSADFQTVIYKENRDDWRRAEIVVTTVQSLLFNNKYQRLFSPTDFDLVISDEVLNQHIFKVGFDESRAIKMYLLHALNKAVIEVEENLHGGVGLVHITKGNLEKIEIPLPPLEVQKEIVAEIEGYQKVINGARAVLDHYRPHIPIHPDWPVFELSEVTTKITDGAHFTPTYVESGIPFLRVTDITESNTSKKFIPQEEHDELIKRCHPEKGDVLYSKNGTIGIAKLVDWDWEFSIFVSLCLIKPKKELLDPHYLKCFLNSDMAYAQATARSKSGTVTNLHLVDIKTIKIPVPPLATERACEHLFIHANAERHDYLLRLLDDFGFSQRGHYKGDLVLVKVHPHMAPEGESIEPLEYARRYFPHYRHDAAVQKFVIPIQPQYHNLLLPDYSPRQGQLFASHNNVGNAINSMYAA